MSNIKDFDLETTSKPMEAMDIARNAVKDGFNLLISVGGDGTVNEIVNGMAQEDISKAALGIVPVGSGNDLCKSLGIPADIEKACSILSEGRVGTIDIGKVDDRYFVNGIGIGMDATITEEANKVSKNTKLLKGFSIYLYSAIKVLLFKFGCPRMKIEMNDMIIDTDILLIAITNGKVYGGGFKITPSAEVDDGLLDVCLVERMSRFQSLFNISKLMRGEHLSLPQVSLYKIKEIKISLNKSAVAHIDGEIIKGEIYKVKIFPQKLKVMLPQGDR